MNKKMGRPKLPKGKAKGILFAVKLSNGLHKDLEQRIKLSGLKRAEYGRNALSLYDLPPWLICDRWGYDDLQGKTVEFDIKYADNTNYIRGLGRFWVVKHPDGVRLAIEIHTGVPLGKLMRLGLQQEQADLIERHPKPSVADFRCFAIVRGLQRLR